MSNSLLLFNTGIMTLDAQRRQYNNGAILIEDSRIMRIGKSKDLLVEFPSPTEKIDLGGKWILPGLINTHVHLSQQLARGLADDVDLLTWLHDRIWPYESNMTLEDSYISSLLCGIELIRSGVTCFAEAGGQFVNGMGRAVTELGLRGALTKSTMDMGDGRPAVWKDNTSQALEAQSGLFEQWHGKADGRIRVWLGLRTIFNSSDDLIVRTKELADRLGTGIHMHVAEVKEEVEYAKKSRGASTVTHLDRLGVLGPNLLAVHAVWLTDGEIGLFARNDVKVSHNPAAAMRVLGFAHVPEMLEAGVCVTLGTDGAPCNNRMTLIDEMWLATLINKGRRLDPTVMPAEQVLAMVTIDGSRALNWDHEIGSIEEGKKADLVVINPHTATMLPMHDPVANIINSMRTENVDMVMVDGRWLLKDGKIQTIDEESVLTEAASRANELAKRAGIKLPHRFQVVDD